MYSQNQEEKVILEYFGDFIGTFASIGENDGETFSNVRALALKGWRGVCVEPSPKAFERLKKLYRDNEGVYCYPFAIGANNKIAPFRQSGSLIGKNDTGLVSTFIQSEEDRFKKTVPYETIEVKMFRWKTFYNRLKIKTFDFVSIDCEGLDLEILSQIDIKDVKCICLEWNGKEDLKKEFERYLSGFKLIYTSGENLIYSR